MLEAKGLVKEFPADGMRKVRALRSVSLEIAPGDSIGLVGESGSGKSTLGRCLLRLIDPTEGKIYFENQDITRIGRRNFRGMRSKIQMVFQDPLDSLNPRWPIEEIIAEPLLLLRRGDRRNVRSRVIQLLNQVRLSHKFLDRYPHQLSGGQQQRVGIARALAVEPRLIVLDEPTSALDWITRAAILDLLRDLQTELGVAYLFISHDLSAVRAVCKRIAVMYLGRIVEEADTETIFANPSHPYTACLLSALLDPVPQPSRSRIRLGGEPPSPLDVPIGCSFAARCPVALAQCARMDPTLHLVADRRKVACHRRTDQLEPLQDRWWLNEARGSSELISP